MGGGVSIGVEALHQYIMMMLLLATKQTLCSSGSQSANQGVALGGRGRGTTFGRNDAGRRGVDGISIGHRSCGNTHSASVTYGGYAVAIGFESAYDGNGAKAIAIGSHESPNNRKSPSGPNCI